jgi:hypothetical protein
MLKEVCMRRAALLLVPLFLFACDRQPVAPEISPSFDLGAMTVTLTMQGTYNLCGFDMADYVGTRHITYRYVPNEDGSGHYQEHHNIKLEMVGRNTGYTWRYNDNRNYQSQFGADFEPDVYVTDHQVLHIIGYDGAPSFDANYLFRYTVNANGDLVQESHKIEPLCN